MKHLLTIVFLTGFVGLFAEGDTILATLFVKALSVAFLTISARLLPRYLTSEELEEIEDEEV